MNGLNALLSTVGTFSKTNYLNCLMIIGVAKAAGSKKQQGQEEAQMRDLHWGRPNPKKKEEELIS